VESWHDDLRDSKLKDASFEIVINDFRLNFNQDDQQNLAMMKNTWRVLKPGGIAIISTVVDGKYENVRYGVDQEKAPINAKRPGQFQGDEHLVRRAWSVPYWRQLFGKVGFSKVQEFDIEEGKRWGAGLVSLSVDPWSGPFYRRWVIVK
jgi:ubiquinone/menaquinone biosynthesis C-methylase UbiE